LQGQPRQGLWESFKEYLQRQFTWGDVYLVFDEFSTQFSTLKSKLISSVQSGGEHKDPPNLDPTKYGWYDKTKSLQPW
jgi:hypothetical protein